ncbi:GIY-YIG nuclease family protein [Candidatus Pacearchaeota archaeon]|nr:GIY-YIG nuclease family protein [Candidatus Pacearchaeota archaeon]
MKIKQDVKSVYIIWNEELKRTKIGFSDNVEKRFYNIMTQSGCRMKLIYHTKPIYNYAQVEYDMHQLFGDKRGIGEWFYIGYEKPVQRLKRMVIDKDVCQIIRHFESGKNPTKIANMIGVSRSGVVKYLNSKGYNLKDTHGINNIPKALIKTKSKAPCLSSEIIAEMVAKNKIKQ